MSIVGADFVVKNNGVDRKLSLLKAGHNDVSSCKYLLVMLGCKQLDEDGVYRVVVGNHDELVATLCMDGEATRVIHVQGTEQEFAQVDEVALWCQGCFATCWRVAIWMRLHGTHMLT